MRFSIYLWIICLVYLALIVIPTTCYDYYYNKNTRNFYEPWRQTRWGRPVQTRSVGTVQHFQTSPITSNEERYLKPDTIYKISETLGALNTVGSYLINMTRGIDKGENVPEKLPGAIYTLSKNVLGRNVTDVIAPLVREALPAVVQTTPQPKPTTESSDTKTCTTPDGTQGECTDLSDCPQLLLNLENLRQSLCFKSLFVPGVCCSKTSNELSFDSILSSQTVQVSTIRPITPASSGVVPPRSPEQNLPLLVDPKECGQPESAKFRVVGGEESASGKWPWMAAIFLHGPKRSEFWCGGTLITARHILTAAHCTKDSRQRPFAARQFTVVLGDVDLKKNDEPSSPVTHKVSEIRSHKEFSRVGFYNDISILVLDGPARKTKYIIPICIPPPELKREKFAGQRATVVGWGTKYYGGKESTTQQEAILPIWRNEDCDQSYFQPITKNFVCAGYAEGGVDACQGDSGGPLMLFWDTRWVQIGVVSFGNKCGEPGYPGVYTRVTEYLDWIKENTKT